MQIEEVKPLVGRLKLQSLGAVVSSQQVVQELQLEVHEGKFPNKPHQKHRQNLTEARTSALGNHNDDAGLRTILLTKNYTL